MNWTNMVGKFSLFFIVLLCTIVIEWAISNQFDFPFHTHQNKKFIVSHDWKSIQFIFVHFIWHYFHFPAASEWEIIGTFFKKKYTHRHVWTYWTIHPPVYFINKKKPSLLCCFYEKKAALYCPIKKKKSKVCTLHTLFLHMLQNWTIKCFKHKYTCSHFKLDIAVNCSILSNLEMKMKSQQDESSEKKRRKKERSWKWYAEKYTKCLIYWIL